MTDSKDELRARFESARDRDEESERGSSGDTGNGGNEGNSDNTGNTGESGETGDAYDWSDKYNYPFYVPREFADELDQLYNQYDGKNKVGGGDGLEKHREFLFPIMRAAVEELDLDEVVDWEVEE